MGRWRGQSGDLLNRAYILVTTDYHSDYYQRLKEIIAELDHYAEQFRSGYHCLGYGGIAIWPGSLQGRREPVAARLFHLC